MVYFDKREERVGAMTRHITGDIIKEFNTILKTCYSIGGATDTVGEHCCKWHIVINRYVVDEELRDTLVNMLQYFFEQHLDVDRLPGWKKIMRLYLPLQIQKKINNSSQIVKLAAMDSTEYTKDESVVDAKDQLW